MDIFRKLTCTLHGGEPMQFKRTHGLDIDLFQYKDVRVCLSCIGDAKIKLCEVINRAKEARHERRRNRPRTW